MLEVLRYGSKGEVKGSQTEDGKDVTRNQYKRIARDGEDSRYGVNGKGYIGALNDKEGDK